MINHELAISSWLRKAPLERNAISNGEVYVRTKQNKGFTEGDLL